jgi:hypothetical protein
MDALEVRNYAGRDLWLRLAEICVVTGKWQTKSWFHPSGSGEESSDLATVIAHKQLIVGSLVFGTRTKQN